MRLYEFDESSALDTVVAEVTKNCGPYIQEIGSWADALLLKPMWRGLRRVSMEKRGTDQQLLTTVTLHGNRRPTDMPFGAHKIIDAWFNRHFGIPYRSNAFFATGSQEYAKEYGTPHVLIPIGDVSYCWSMEYSDLFGEIDTKVDWDMPGDQRDYAMVEDQVIDLLELGNYTNRSIKNAIVSGHEIMVHSPAAFLLHEKYHLQLLAQYNKRNRHA